MPEEITTLLAAWRDGDSRAPRRIFALVYDELRGLARGQIRGPRRGRTIDTTGLVHETYLKLVGGSPVSLRDREHFFALAATAMRQILVDYARQRSALKRGGHDGAGEHLRLDDVDPPAPERLTDLLAINEALTKLEGIDPRLAKVVEMRFFAGLSLEEIATVLDMSARTIKRDWHKARAFLFLELGGDGST